MRLYTPAKSSSPGAEDGEQRQDASIHHQDRAFVFDSRPAQLAHRSLVENETRFDEKLQINAVRNNDKAQLQLARLEDTLQFRDPRQEERQIGPPASPPLTSIFGTEFNGVPIKQNGPRSLDFSPTLLENGTDTLGSLDSVPWNTEGTETIKENGCRSLLSKWSLTSEEETQDTEGLSEEAELHQVKDENQRLKAALKETAEMNDQWRHYHDHRQKYVQRLLTTIQDLQHPRPSATSPRQMEGEAVVGPEAEIRRLRETLTHLHADHDEHVNLLEMQVRAHRDDWEAERSEKQATQTALAEAQARTALLLQELQLLQAKLADSESKRGLCWRCLAPRGEANGGGPATSSSSSSHSAQASPVPAPSATSPGPSLPAAQTHDQPQAPLKGWIPVSMLHHIAFSGATPEHQTPVVQSQQQQQAGRQQGQRHPGPSTPASRPTTLNTNCGRRTEADQPAAAESASSSSSSSSCEPKTLGPRATCAPDAKASGTTDDRKKYEAMGARPKVLGDLQTVTGKGVGLLEDEKTAKHRARSILASAIPVSPVSSGPSTPFGSGVIRSPSTPNMPKGYMPITSTVLTPINFRQPFVAHKRPSAMKTVTQATVQDSSSSSTTAQTRSSCSSPASTSGTNATTTTTTTSSSSSSSSHTRHTSNKTTAKDTTTTVSKQTRTSQVNDRIKPSAAINQEKKVTKDHSHRNETQSSKPAAGSRKGGSNSHANNRHQPSAGEFTAISCCSATTVTTTTITSGISSTNTAAVTCSGLTAATTTVSCSSPATTTTTTSSSSDLNSAGVSAEALSSGVDDHPLVNESTSQPSSSKSTAYKPSSKSTLVPQASSNTTASQPPSSTKKISQASCSSIAESQSSTKNTTNSSTVSKTSSHDGSAPQTCSTDNTTSQSCSTSNTTAFASITVTTTAAPSAPSTYSSATSSRSSSPGVSLTTFGLNSEGRGIPGAIFFALGSDQRGVRSPQPCASPRRASTSSAGVKSPTPDTLTAGQTQRDALPPSGVKSPPVCVNSSPAPATVKEEHWWSVESPSRTGTAGRYQGGQGKLVNSTWVRLMGGQANSHQGSGLPWRTARAVSGQQLNQARKAPQEEHTNGPASPSSVSSSTATFNYIPAVNSPPSSTLSSATNSAASSPPPSLNQRSSDDLKSMASKNIASAIMSYELGAKCEAVSGSTGPGGASDGVATLTRRDLVCPSCQMLFPPDKHVHFLDHFEACRGPEYADL